MKPLRMAVAVACLLAAGPLAAWAADFDVQPVGPQDGTIWDNVGTDGLTGQYGLWGFVNGNYYSQAGIHTLPAILPGQVQSAELIIPANHGEWTPGTGRNLFNMNWVVEHFDAIDDTTLTGGLSGTGDFQQPALSTLGLYASPPYPGQDNNRTVNLDVTAAVVADLTASRLSTAWRIVPTQPSTQGFNDNAQCFFPTVEMPEASGYPHRGAVLSITLVPEPASAGVMLLGLTFALFRRRRA